MSEMSVEEAIGILQQHINIECIEIFYSAIAGYFLKGCDLIKERGFFDLDSDDCLKLSTAFRVIGEKLKAELGVK